MTKSDVRQALWDAGLGNVTEDQIRGNQSAGYTIDGMDWSDWMKAMTMD